MSQFNSHSPPPLRHPVPTHPAYIPDPPPTPGSPRGYQRFSSSPGPASHGGQQPTPFRSLQPPIHSQYQQEGPAPDFGAWGLDATTAKFGMQLGHSAVAAGQQYVQKNVSS